MESSLACGAFSAHLVVASRVFLVGWATCYQTSVVPLQVHLKHLDGRNEEVSRYLFSSDALRVSILRRVILVDNIMGT